MQPRSIPSTRFTLRQIAAGDDEKMASCLREQAALVRELDGIQLDERNYIARVQPWTDASVVDARAPAEGAYYSNQVPELRNSPQVNQINAGFSAILSHDWPAALGWWQQALLQDPNNGALKRSVDLAQWMVDRKNSQKAGLVSPLKAAQYNASKGDWGAAIKQFEAAKIAHPEIGRYADDMVATLKEKQISAKYWDKKITQSNTRIIADLQTDGLWMQMAGMDSEARKSWELADFLSMLWLPCGGRTCPK